MVSIKVKLKVLRVDSWKVLRVDRYFAVSTVHEAVHRQYSLYAVSY